MQAIATNGVALLDTSLAHSTQAGWSQVLGPGLDRAKGFALLFSAQLDAETHKNTNRAGFSVILLADDKQGIELGFWTDTIFAQSDAPLFTRAEFWMQRHVPYYRSFIGLHPLEIFLPAAVFVFPTAAAGTNLISPKFLHVLVVTQLLTVDFRMIHSLRRHYAKNSIEIVQSIAN